MSTSIALVGRPNVGKSRLFNRLVKRRISIVHDQPGTTRDVIIETLPNDITLMDTGGMGLSSSQEEMTLLSAVEMQVHFALQAAEVIFFVVDARMGCVPLDCEIAAMLRKFSKKVYLIVNKIDSEKEINRSDAFHGLGFSDVIPVSAEHGYGEWDLWKVINQYAQSNENEKENNATDTTIKINLLGRPNVGKSSIVNALLKENRMIVNPKAGTTRDSVRCNLHFTVNHKGYHFQLVDTAGLREKKKVNTSLEFFSALRSERAIDFADITFLVVDALSGIRRQDKKLLGQVLEKGKCFALIVNKWDFADDHIKQSADHQCCSIGDFQEKFVAAIRKELFALAAFPILFVSAKTGYGIEHILREGADLFERASAMVSTGKLNRVIQNLFDRHPPAAVSGKRFKIYYAVHCKTFPFRLKIFCNRAQRLSEPYRRYLENGIRSAFDLSGCPLVFEFIDKEMRYAPSLIKSDKGCALL
jgi:GTP-binding protein